MCCCCTLSSSHYCTLSPPSLCHCCSPHPGAQITVVSPKNSDPGSLEDMHMPAPQTLALPSLQVHLCPRTKVVPHVPDPRTPAPLPLSASSLNLVPKWIPLARTSFHRQKRKTPAAASATGDPNSPRYHCHLQDLCSLGPCSLGPS